MYLIESQIDVSSHGSAEDYMNTAFDGTFLTWPLKEQLWRSIDIKGTICSRLSLSSISSQWGLSSGIFHEAVVSIYDNRFSEWTNVIYLDLQIQIKKKKLTFSCITFVFVP